MGVSGCRIRYLRVEDAATLGEKLNAGFATAGGQIFQKLDDDDFYAPDFLETASAALLSASNLRALAAWEGFLVLFAGRPELRFSGYEWRSGGTFCFHRQLWEHTKFRPAGRGVDRCFLEDSRPLLVRVRAPESYIVLRHGSNTWQTSRQGRRVDEYFARQPVYGKTLEEIAGPEAAAFYRSLRQPSSSGPAGSGAPTAVRGRNETPAAENSASSQPAEPSGSKANPTAG